MRKMKFLSKALAAVMCFTFAWTPVQVQAAVNEGQGDPEEVWIDGLYGDSVTPDEEMPAEEPVSEEPGIPVPISDEPDTPEPSEPGTEIQHPEHEVSLEADALSMNLAKGYQSGWEELGNPYICENRELRIQGLESSCTVYARVLNENGNRTSKVVTVLGTDSVKIFPKSTGNYTLEITVDQKTFTCSLKVFKYYFTRSSKTVADNKSKTWVEDASMLALYPKESVTLSAKSSGISGTVKWASSDKSVATVTSKGKVTAKRAGYAEITAEKGGEKITYHVGVAAKTAVQALRKCYGWYGKLSYSQPRRMQKNYADCSSFVWRGYKKAGKTIGNKYIAFTAAGLSDWCKQQGYRIYEGEAKIENLLPGDLIFWCGAKNGRSNGIYHVDIYQGNNRTLTVEREKTLYGKLKKVIVARPCMSTLSGVKAKTGDDHKISLSWTRQFGVSGYSVYRSTKKNGKYKKVGSVKGSDNSAWTSGKLKQGRTYYYKVRPYWKENGKTFYGPYSKIVGKKAG